MKREQKLKRRGVSSCWYFGKRVPHEPSGLAKFLYSFAEAEASSGNIDIYRGGGLFLLAPLIRFSFSFFFGVFL